MKTSERIKYERKRAGLTQKQLAEKLGTSPQNLAQYENGKRNPKMGTLQKIADALNVPTSSLVDGPSESQRIKSLGEWIRNNDEKREQLIIELLNTHGYKVEYTNRYFLTITDHQGFSFYVRKDSFQDMIERCDKDIRYNIEKLLSESKEITDDKE